MKFVPSTNLKRGFTLIELLVVIAIIGILSSVVLASLNTARQKGTDAKIQSEVRSIAVNAEIYYDNSGNTYGADADACNEGIFASTNPNIAQIVTDLTAAAPDADPICGATATAFAISHRLTASTTQFFCADSTGNVQTEGTGIVAGATVCP